MVVIHLSCRLIEIEKMIETKLVDFIREVLDKMPSGWLSITTHRLDIYDEKLAKVQFLEQFENLYASNNVTLDSLSSLPTAYDYIRLGHPLSCILEWLVSKSNNVKPSSVISFSSQKMPIFAILRNNLLTQTKTKIFYSDDLPIHFNREVLKKVYGYEFELEKVDSIDHVSSFDGSTLFISNQDNLGKYELNNNVDFLVNLHSQLGSLVLINGEKNKNAISAIQHVRRRETIAMTPAHCLTALRSVVNMPTLSTKTTELLSHKKLVSDSIHDITNTNKKVLVASSGLSIQYAILMGLIHHATLNHQGKEIKIIVPTNCYGGTNDQARRVAACINNVEVVDLAVDGENDMVQSIENVLSNIARQDAVPLLIAEIPTNPRVEVPNLQHLKEVLSKKRFNSNGQPAIDPVFILDQTFCPNVTFLGENDILSTVRTISFSSGSKFPSGGLCTAGYCIGNLKALDLIDHVEFHLSLCDNEATELQYEILASQLPSMKQRIIDAYQNTREFVNFISETLPSAKINFVSDELSNKGFMPSVFSLDLPTKGKNDEEKEKYKRALNLKLINLMITEIPNESKFCVSYGQLKGCYWTIPATSTQGTTKEGDKDYIVRASLSPNLNLDLHKKVFLEFVNDLN